MSLQVNWKPVALSVVVGFATGFLLVWNAIV